MKKYILALCLLVLLLTGCNKREPAPKIENYSWTLDTVQRFEDEGQVVACGSDSIYAAQDVPVVELTARAVDGALTLTDLTNDHSYVWSYRHMQDDPQSNIYEISAKEDEGMASVSMTNYHDGSQVATLIVRLNDYALNFKAK